MAQFFEATCSAIFNNLLHANSLDGGLFGPISIYFGTVETNGRGMLHLHCLVRLKGAFHLTNLRHRLLSDPEYANRMVEFIDRIIKCSIVQGEATQPNPDAPSAYMDETDTEFAQRLADDSNTVAAKRQMHSISHNATCFKYGAAGTGKCRFKFPHPLINLEREEKAFVDLCRPAPRWEKVRGGRYRIIFASPSRPWCTRSTYFYDSNFSHRHRHFGGARDDRLRLDSEPHHPVISQVPPTSPDPSETNNLRTVDGTTLPVYEAYEAWVQVRDHFGTASTKKQVFPVFAGETHASGATEFLIYRLLIILKNKPVYFGTPGRARYLETAQLRVFLTRRRVFLTSRPEILQ